MQTHALFTVIGLGFFRAEGFECGLRGCKKELRPVCGERIVGGSREVMEFGNPCLMARANDCGGGFVLCESANSEPNQPISMDPLASQASEHSNIPMSKPHSAKTESYQMPTTPMAETPTTEPTTESSFSPILSTLSTTTENGLTSTLASTSYPTTETSSTWLLDTTGWNELTMRVKEPMSTLPTTIIIETTAEVGSTTDGTEVPSTEIMTTLSTTTEGESATISTEIPSTPMTTLPATTSTETTTEGGSTTISTEVPSTTPMTTLPTTIGTQTTTDGGSTTIGSEVLSTTPYLL